MWKQILITVACLVYLVGGLVGIALAEHTQVIETTNITYINGDWLINDSQNRTNETIVLTGNLLVMFGGNLTFRNVTLLMNCTSDGQYQIEVQNGGTLSILDFDNDNITSMDTSNIIAYNSNFEYKFRVRTGANFTMRNSELHECGYGPFLAVDNYGLYIESDNSLVDNCVISNCYYGIILYKSESIVSNNTITWCDIGIMATAWSNATIENNQINWSDTYGIWVDGVDNTKKWGSNPLIKNTLITYTGRGGPGGVGVHMTYYCRPILENVTILRSAEDGIYFGEWCQPNLINCIVDSMGEGNYALASSSCRYVDITNSSIGTGNVWDMSLATAYFLLTNCSFNEFHFEFYNVNSNLTVNWFLNTYINDTLENPIPNANIRIRDNANGTFDENFTTGGNGFLNWTVLKEYFQKDINGDKDGNDLGERINYGPYNLTVSKPGYQTAYAEIEMNASKTVVITLTDIENPIADAGLDQTVNEDTIVYFDGSGSTDNAEIVNYTWSFNDGGPLVNLYGVNTSYIFAQPGNYAITLNVSDASGNQATDTCIIYVNDCTAPVADAGTDQSVDEDEMIQFDGNGSTDNVGIIWYNWSFGDGGYDFGTNVTTIHTYTNAGDYIVVLNVSDAAGNWATDTCLVFVNNIAPFANAGGNKTGNEGVAITFNGSASADTPSDNSTLTYVWYFGDGNSQVGKVVNHAYADNDVYNATLVVTDDNGRVDSDTCNVTVNNVAPAIMSVANQTAQQGVLFTLRINATDVPADVLTFSDNTTLFDINPVTGIIQFTPTNGDVGNYFINVTVTDDDMGSSSITFKITVNNTNDAPVIAPIPAQSATEDVPFTLQVIATDPDISDTLTYSLTAYPTGMAIASTGLITWTPTNDAVGSHTVTVRVRDAIGLYDEKTFAITVANLNDVPTISTSSLTNATEDAMYLYTIQANDVDVGDTLTFFLDLAPVFLSIDSITGLLYGTPTNSDAGIHQVIVNVSDGMTYITRAFNLTVINVNDPPTLNYISPQAAIEDVPFSLQIVGQDVDAGDILAYSLISSPASMTINQVTGLLAWTPTNDDVGSHTINVRVSDASGAFAERTFQITVANVNDPPVIITTAIPNATEGIMYLATIQAEDADGDALTFSFDSAPSFLSIDTKTGMLYGMPTNGEVGIHQIVVNVSDGTSYVTRTFNLTVLNVNELPTITSYPISVAKPGSEYVYTIIAEDIDAGDVLTFSFVEAPEGMTINSQTGKIIWTPSDAQAGQTYQVVVQVSDGQGSATQIYSIAVDELPVEPYQPLFDDYVWTGIIILLVTIILLMLFYQFNKEKKKEKEPDNINKES
jgi:parallel beta-helix repeat protein